MSISEDMVVSRCGYCNEWIPLSRYTEHRELHLIAGDLVKFIPRLMWAADVPLAAPYNAGLISAEV